MEFKCYDDLKETSIQEGDIINFKISGRDEIRYKVEKTFLSNSAGNGNDYIFLVLGLNKKTFCDEIYGYDSGSGGFPDYRYGDYDAVKKVVLELYKNIEGTSKKSNNVFQDNKMEKKAFSVLAINKKTGKVEKDVKVVAVNSEDALLKAFGVDKDDLAISTTEIAGTSFKVDEPLNAVLVKAKAE